MKESKTILLTFNGNQDPFTKGSADGPVLSLLKVRNDYSKIVLFHTPDRNDAASRTAEIIKEQIKIEVDTVELSISDPTSYREILKSLRPAIRNILDRAGNAFFEILVAPGTSQMHACWLLLAASGEIPATVIHKREEKYVKPGQELVTVIDPLSVEFPRIMPNIMMEEIPAISEEELNQSLQKANIIGKNEGIKEAVRRSALAAGTNVPILILGESGTGKELFARFVHMISTKSSGPFITVNCSALPESLAESELFGHVKGAFTGAIRDKKGLFTLAHGGTLFLDEIGDMPLSLQAKLLRVLQDGEIRPVGATDSSKVAVRVISATNVDLIAAVKEKRFRDDLYYRLSMMSLSLPTLRERSTDIPAIALHILGQWNREQQTTKRFAPDALQHLREYSWPGNIRELKNVIISSAILSSGETMGITDIQLPAIHDRPLDQNLPEPAEGFIMNNYICNIRDSLIKRALSITAGNKNKAAKLLGLTAQGLGQHMAKLNKSKP